MWVKGSGLDECVDVWIFWVCALKCEDFVDVSRCEFCGCYEVDIVYII